MGLSIRDRVEFITIKNQDRPRRTADRQVIAREANQLSPNFVSGFSFAFHRLSANEINRYNINDAGSFELHLNVQMIFRQRSKNGFACFQV